ncbi:MAG: ATP-binding cassette domain-containing protein [Phycisphaerales bacterium]|nr:MAG: ATP-binding cassette domain-containing protein [Phycisphaerales bacterium]
MIHFDQFSWRFGSAGTWALRDVSLRIDRGEFVAVAGPSGSGKTTLAQAMCGLLIGRQAGDARGNVQVGDHDVAAAPLHQVAQSIGLVQQNPETHFATLAVDDEIAFGMENRCVDPDQIHRRSAEAMQLLSITHLRDRSLPTLSGGEKQRVAIASIVAGDPDVLVLDEPTASLDPQASRDLFHSLADLCRRTGLTVVIIEHKLAHLLPLNPRLIRLEGSRVAADTLDATVYAPDPLRPTDANAAHGLGATAGPVPTSGDPVVDMSRVSVALGDRTVLDDVSLRVWPGEMVAMLGPNGGGKTTLLHSLMGLVPLAGGSIRVCGVAVSPNTVSRLAEQVGLVFQNADHQLFADTVWHETLFAVRNLKRLDAGIEKEAARLLDRAGLSPREADHPYRLSWGEKRRLNLISAILHRPRLLLLDEPFAGQDWENVAFLLDVLRRWLSGGPADRPDDTPNSAEQNQPHGACLMVTHDPRIVLRSCTRVLFVSDGQVTLDAPVPEAFNRLRQAGHDAYAPPERVCASGSGQQPQPRGE